MTIDLPPLIGAGMSPRDMTKLDGITRLSNSEIQTFKRCRRKWYLTYYRNLQPRGKTRVGPMAIGSRLHTALQYHYESRIPGSTNIIDARDALEALIERERIETFSDPEFNNDIEAQFNAEADLQRIMIDGYLDWLAETGDDSNYEIISAEAYREAAIDTSDLDVDKPVLIIARLDLRVKRLSDGVSLHLDHKTTASFPALIKQLPTNEQMLFYILIEFLQDDPQFASGALYNMIKRNKRSVRAKPPFFERISVYHNRIELNAFLRRTQGVIENILITSQRLDHGMDHRRVVYPTPTRDCAWDCPFAIPCKMMDDGSYAEEMLQHAFDIGDPYKYYTNGSDESDDTSQA